MDKNEVITLSSDDETEATVRIEKNLNAKHLNPAFKSGYNISSELNNTSGVIVINNTDKQYETTNKDSPEVVDLEDFIEKSNEVSSSENDQSSELDVIDLEESSEQNDSSCDEKTNLEETKKLSLDQIKTVTSNSTIANPDNSKEFNKNLEFFTEFVEYCGSLEKNPNDRFKLTRKLMKHYGETDCSYIRSQEFKQLIEKFRTKLNENNLYLIAQEITKEFSFKKKIDLCSKSKEKKEDAEKIEETENSSLKLTKKRARFINKIIKNLDKLGSKIRELEEQEVDLSDEEDSSYVLLQRYRERFCQIYKRFCDYTNQVPDPNNRRIYFTESKYPAINKCIENWLNKTKCFPDFSDIVKLLESQSESLGLPSNRELFRTIAVEIFQKVGIMLQRRRKYELWDLFCGLLDDGKDPADEDPDLDQTLKNNLQSRLKKEDEIFQHFAELQEKEKLEPEEILDEEANNSPVESGNEDDKEIEEIENCLNKRMDDAIKNGEISENKNNSDNETQFSSPKPENTVKSKETKNNYKNCKSLKWRQENSDKSNSDNSVSEDSSAGTENEKDTSENVAEQKEKSQKPEGVEKNDIIIVEDSKIEKEETKTEVTPRKRVLITKTENPVQKKKKYDEADCNENEKSNEVFGVHCCQIFQDNVFLDLSEEKKDWEKRKVFRDLTNVNKLMELHGKRKKMSGLFSPSFFHRSFCEFEKSSWKKRFKVNFRLVCSKDQKCALNEEEKTTKSVNSDSGGDSDEKDNLESGGDDEGNDFIKSHGNGNEEDNNGDKNKKSGGTNDEINERQHEDEEDEEEEEETEKEKTENVVNVESLEISIQKTEKFSDCVHGDKTPSHNENCSDLCKLAIRDTQTEATDSKFNQNTKNDEGMQEKSEVVKNKKVENGTAADVIDVEVEDSKAIIGKTENIAEESEKKNLSDEVIVANERIVEQEGKYKSMTPLKSKSHLKNLKLKPGLDIKNKTPEPTAPLKVEVKQNKWQTLQLDLPTKKPHRRNSPSDEERVKKFLMHSPSSISITPPKKLTLSKPPSQAALQALATLQSLKGISATIVRSKPKTEDDVIVVEGTSKRRSDQSSAYRAKHRRHDLPVISNVQSMASSTPTIVTVQGNVSGFEEPVPENGDSSSIRISSVWGSLPPQIRIFNEVVEKDSGCSSRQDHVTTGRKKMPKKPVEYVVLE